MKQAIFSVFLLGLLLFTEPVSSYAHYRFPVTNTGTLSEKFLRTELFFGLSKRSGGQVSEAEWTKFLDEIVTPAFPDGYTVVDADGRFRDGLVTISEKSKVLIVLYPKSSRSESRRKLDAIRAAYVKQFDQKSVMRMDLPGAVNVMFE